MSTDPVTLVTLIGVISSFCLQAIQMWLDYKKTASQGHVNKVYNLHSACCGTNTDAHN